MENKNLLRIEFDKVLEMLSEEACGKDSKDMCLSIIPSSETETVRRLLNETSDAYKLLIRLGNPPLTGIKSVLGLLNKSRLGAILSNLDLLNVLSTLTCIRRLKQWKNQDKKNTTCIDHKFSEMTENNYLENRISKSIISETDVADEASLTLREIRSKINHLNHKIKDKMNKIINSNHYKKYLMDSIITTRSGRFVVPVKSEHRDVIKGLVHDVSSSGLTLFIEPITTVEDNNEINKLKNMEKNEIEKILKELSKDVSNFSESIYSSYLCLIGLDIIFAKALLAFKMKAFVPIVNDQGIVNLKSARHPLIDKDKVTPIDIMLGKNFDTLIITGPNTGGKTVAIKTLGLMCAMGMCGLMLPTSDDSEISVFKNILTDIGDEQSIEKSISTFSSHIKNVTNILNESGNNTLILIDEIGSGTDPEEGAALAISIIEELRGKNCKIAVTTHYKELKEYAIKTKGVQSASCEFDIDTMKPTYKLYFGGIGASNAFIVSEKLGISKHIIEYAEKILGEEKVTLNKFWSHIEKTRKDLDAKKQRAEELYNEAKAEKAKVEIQIKKIGREKERIIEESNIKAINILDKVRRESQIILKELSRVKSTGKTLLPGERREIKNKIGNLKKLTFREEQCIPVIDRNVIFKEGNNVLISNIGKEGKIVSEEDDRGNILVNVGNIKMKINKRYLRLIKDKEVKNQIPKSSFSTVKMINRINTSMEINLRGKTSDEAIHELGIFIDNCVMSGLHQITIIHGKGTGVLKREIHKYLKVHKNITNFRLGVFGEGENGVTIAELE